MWLSYALSLRFTSHIKNASHIFMQKLIRHEVVYALANHYSFLLSWNCLCVYILRSFWGVESSEWVHTLDVCVEIELKMDWQGYKKVYYFQILKLTHCYCLRFGTCLISYWIKGAADEWPCRLHWSSIPYLCNHIVILLIFLMVIVWVHDTVSAINGVYLLQEIRSSRYRVQHA